jgi:hypothetical protein
LYNAPVVLPAPIKLEILMLETFTLETFTPLVNSAFRVGGESPTELLLVAATALGGHGVNRAPFSLLFRGPRTPLLPQQIHPLEHDTLGAFDLFLVPLGPDAEGMRYEAIFA